MLGRVYMRMLNIPEIHCRGNVRFNMSENYPQFKTWPFTWPLKPMHDRKTLQGMCHDLWATGAM